MRALETAGLLLRYGGMRRLGTFRIWPFWAWLVAACLCLGALALVEYRSGLAALAARLSEAETALAEKLAQHDAHLTALAALARMPAGDAPQVLQGAATTSATASVKASASVQALAEAIETFYPRITEIATIETATGREILYGGANGPQERPADVAALPKLEKAGSTVLEPRPDQAGYTIIKLAAPGLFLRMGIDARALLDPTLAAEGEGLRLTLGPDLLVGAAPAPALLAASRAVAVNSASQPLGLEMTRGFSLGDLLPPMAALPLLLALAAVAALVGAYRRAVLARRQGESRAALLEQETRLAHAGRVNALGEMASGIAHELAQPVAALLSQSQAARRAMAQERPDIVERALEANIGEAKRAGDILARMRASIAGEPPEPADVAVAEALSDALALIRPQLAQQGIAFTLDDATAGAVIRIDAIAFQQVLHNLLRNAAEALLSHPAPDAPRLALSARRRGAMIEIEVRDNGPGIPAAVLPRIFEPFYTTKAEGMGLGLPLSARLIEQMEGTLAATSDHGAQFTIRLPLRNLPPERP